MEDYTMVTQKAISAKIDERTLYYLDKAIKEGCRYETRNRAINKAIELYTLVLAVEQGDEGWTPENQLKLANSAHNLYLRWK